MFIADLKHAVRSLVRARGFTGVAIATLGAALGLAVTVTAVVNAYLLRLLPYPASDRLYSVQYGPQGQLPPRELEKLDWASLNDVVEHAVAWDLDLINVRGAPYPVALTGAWVTRGFAEGLGIRPVLGRPFEAADFEAGRPNVALISHAVWRSRFDGDPGVVGRPFEAFSNDRPNEAESFTVIGVLPEQFWHLNAYTEVLAPLRAPTFPYMVRLREGVSAAVAAGRIMSLIRGANPALPDDWRVELPAAQAAYVRTVRPVLVSAAAATGLVVLIACANVAVLVLVRATKRRQEVAVRRALGATAPQIARTIAAEAVVLAGCATAAGLAAAQFALSTVAPVIDRQLGRPVPGGVAAIQLDGVALATVVAGGLLFAFVCLVPPLVASGRTSLSLSSGQKGATDSRAHARARSVLIAIEVAACLTLLVGAALMVDSGLRMLRLDFGLQVRDVHTTSLTIRQRTYPTTQSRAALVERLIDRAAGTPGVDAIALTSAWPLQDHFPRPVGLDAPDAAATTQAGAIAVTPGYFDAVRVPLRAGRLLTAADRIGAEPAAVISETLARRLWGSRPAVGERLRIQPVPAFGQTSSSAVTVVGVVGDARQTYGDGELADIYLSLLQQPPRGAFVYVRKSPSAQALQVERDVRGAFAAVDPEAPLTALRPLADVLDAQRAAPRFLAGLLVVFSSFAAVLALLGIYGVIAYTVRQREREIAVRLAVGADPGAITRLFLRQGGLVLAAGLALGVGGALALGRVLETQLFGVRSADPWIIAATTLAFAVCGLLAIGLPARLAAATDPATALTE